MVKTLYLVAFLSVFQLSLYFLTGPFLVTAPCNMAHTMTVSKNVDAPWGKKNDFAWIVVYHHFKDKEGETELFLKSYEMFHNKQVYQKVLFVWDSSQDDDLDILLRNIPPSLAGDFMHIDLATETTLKPDFGSIEFKLSDPKCFNRKTSYCEMLYMKMVLDLAVREAAKKYGTGTPQVLAIADGDAYWHTLPVRENVIDSKGRLLLHTEQCDEASRMFSPGVHELLHTGHHSDTFKSVVFFPVHLWFDTLPNMRDRVGDMDQLSPNDSNNDLSSTRSFFDIYAGMRNPLCEYCLMATYALLYETDRYRFPATHCDTTPRLASENAFQEGASLAAPMVYTMTHDKIELNRTIWIEKGCCLTYRFNAVESKGACTYQVDDFQEIVYLDSWFRTIGLSTSPTLVSDHFERVWRTLDESRVGKVGASRAGVVNQGGREACLRYLHARPHKTAK